MSNRVGRIFRAIFLAAVLTASATAHQAYALSVYVSEVFTGTIRQVTQTGAVSTFATGLTNPTYLAFGPDGNLYAATPGASSISRIAPDGVVSTFYAGISDPHGIAFGSDGNLYVASGADNTISRITPGGVRATFAPVDHPGAIAFDNNGNLFVTDYFGGILSRITAAGVVSPFATGIQSAAGLVFAPDGNLYATRGDFFSASQGPNSIVQITPAGVVSTFATAGGLASPWALAVDSSGILYAANLNGGTVSAIGSQGSVATLASGFTNPYGVAVGPAAVPEPSTLALLIGAFVPVALLARRRMRAAAALLPSR